jgi:hypothetical protein
MPSQRVLLGFWRGLSFYTMSKQKQNYWEKLKDPRWQRKRLEVMERVNFTCQKCYREDQTLNVHHLYYMSKRDPWEYPNFALQCICEECHEEGHGEEKENKVSSFESVITWLVGDDFENPYFFEIANQIREAREKKIFNVDYFLQDCMESITTIRKAHEQLAKEQNESNA